MQYITAIKRSHASPNKPTMGGLRTNHVVCDVGVEHSSAVVYKASRIQSELRHPDVQHAAGLLREREWGRGKGGFTVLPDVIELTLERERERTSIIIHSGRDRTF